MSSQNPLMRLTELGQSVWLDFITREILEDGTLQKLMDEDGVRGMTTNPTIFAQAIRDGERYDADLQAAPKDSSPEAVFEGLAIKDVQRAADFFRPVFDGSNGQDGFVSIECSPTLARDTEGTISEARRLWNSCDRPNVMIKIPGTKEGLPAIRTCLSEGINVNVTLLFSVERYREVVEAWFQGMEDRASRGESLQAPASVASFFVSRVDSLMDKQFDERLAGDLEDDRRNTIENLYSKVGIYNARLAYLAFEELFGGERFASLQTKGASAQRPLWASTSTKSPSLPPTYYVEELVAPQSVNTIPPATLDAYREQGDPAHRIHDDADAVRAFPGQLESLGFDLAAATEHLEEEGVEKFVKSYDELLGTIREQMQPTR